MLEKHQARMKVMEFLLKKYPGHAENWDVHEQTLDKAYGWVFFYDHRRYMREQDRRARLAGNGPIFVEAASGAIHQFGTSATLGYYLDDFEHGRQRTQSR